MADFVSGVGPLFGPDFVIVTVNDSTGTRFDVQIYPDAHNPELRAAGLPTQYYFQPAQVFLARKHDSPQDFDFEMTLFKGLGSEEANVTPAELEGASTEIGGGFCTFSTTFGIPPGVTASTTRPSRGLRRSSTSGPATRRRAWASYRPAATPWCARCRTRT
jgi:hypothetical protein